MTGESTYRVLIAAPPESRRQRLVEGIGKRHDVSTVSAVDAAVPEVPSTDCLVLCWPKSDAVEEILDLTAGHDTAVIVVASSLDRSTTETVSRTGGAEVVFRSSADSGEPIDDAFVETLRRRVDERYRESMSELSEVVLAASRSLMSAAIDEIDTKIEWELKAVGQQLGVDRCAFYRRDDEREQLIRTHAWERDGDSPETERIPSSSFPGFETLSAFEPATFPAIDEDTESVETGGIGDVDIPDDFVGATEILENDDGGSDGGGDEPWPAYLDREGFEAFAAVPVVIDWSLYGVLAVGGARHRKWSDDLCRQLRTFGEHLGYTLQRRTRRRELETQNERLERFASVISHDLQNPISVISGYTELAMETEDIEPLTDVLEAANRMERLVDDLLTLAREGDTVGTTRTVALEPIAESAWGAVDSPEATLRIENSYEFEADPSRLQQVLENLFKNAIEHAGEDVRILVEGTDEGFAVGDDGPGIPPDRRDEVFQEGVTGGDGTGLGLAIVKSVVNGHGWSIEIAESSDGGARFEIEFGHDHAAD